MGVCIDVSTSWEFTRIPVFLVPQVAICFHQGAIGTGDADINQILFLSLAGQLVKQQGQWLRQGFETTAERRASCNTRGT
jgi:hypothetical protein